MINGIIVEGKVYEAVKPFTYLATECKNCDLREQCLWGTPPPRYCHFFPSAVRFIFNKEITDKLNNNEDYK